MFDAFKPLVTSDLLGSRRAALRTLGVDRGPASGVFFEEPRQDFIERDAAFSAASHISV